MKKYTHAWIAMMAIKRLENIKVTKAIEADRKSLVAWFKNYRDFVVAGAWYPDEVFHDMGSSHGVKYQPDSTRSGKVPFRVLPADNSIYKLGKKNKLYGKPYVVTGGNCADRCEAFAQSVIDNLKIQYMQEKGSPVSVSNNHLAMRFFILSHYVADCHMPLHCDSRSFSDGTGIHAHLEEEWDKQVKKSYNIDFDNERFFYDPAGYPLPSGEMSAMVSAVEEQVRTASYTHDWGSSTAGGVKTTNENVWDFMSSVSLYSYLLAYEMLPETVTMDTPIEEIKQSEMYAKLDEYSTKIMYEAINSIARIWLHVWVKYKKWEKEQQKTAK